NDGSVSKRKFEVLNFGIAAYALTQQLGILDERVFRFKPDVVVFTDSPLLVAPIVQHLLHAVAFHEDVPFVGLQRILQETGVLALGYDGVPVPFDFARSLLARAGVKTRMPWVEADRRLRRASDRLIRATLEQMARSTRDRGAVPVFLALDIVLPR